MAGCCSMLFIALVALVLLPIILGGAAGFIIVIGAILFLFGLVAAIWNGLFAR